ncbi:flavin-containing monooxygenase [Terracoccus luteus]|uniref:Putative flavoprotein involved in K+ transport n=1 Tax=Terracoccus luteus TaxID=53356 RepID=A0A839PSW2_9MICO|nr:NAD(P)/FAD-dependent oxidoreductase [Terracoccus luteus]MBB2986153.1 putative flavoprotein involved in K+ transport [Terracoccus luteus]MCP2172257.1 putative flavoprotein involved in K+ transport [Terracoccus luteus]
MGVDELDVVVVGAGQAGLATSHELSARGVEHVVLEAAQPGGSWSERRDSFTLVGPDHTVRLPGATYAGDDPGGFMSGTAVTEHLRDYAARLPAELRTGTPVRRLTPARGGYRLDTDDGAVRARQVVVATGAFQRPLRLPALAGLAPSVAVVDVAGYRNPAALPEGAVLVVGSGQSACQIAEELVLAGRRVVMACGRAPWFPRRVGGRDLFEWLIAAGFYEQTPDDVPPAARQRANVQATGSRGGHDLHHRTLHALGVELAGHLLAVDGLTARVATDLGETLTTADEGHAVVASLVRRVCAAEGLRPPTSSRPRTRRRSWPPLRTPSTSPVSARSSSRAASGRATRSGCRSRASSTSTASRCTSTVRASSHRGCTSSASTSCDGAGRPCSSGSVTTRRRAPSAWPARPDLT